MTRFAAYRLLLVAPVLAISGLAVPLLASPALALDCLQKDAIYHYADGGYFLRFVPGSEAGYEYDVVFKFDSGDPVVAKVKVSESYRQYPDVEGGPMMYSHYYVQNAKGKPMPMPRADEPAAPRFNIEGVKGPGEGDLYVLKGCDK